MIGFDGVEKINRIAEKYGFRYRLPADELRTSGFHYNRVHF